MAVHGDYQKPPSYYQDKQMNHDVQKEWKEDYQKNKYQEKDKYGTRTKYQKEHYYRKETEKTYDQDQEQKKTYGTYGLS